MVAELEAFATPTLLAELSAARLASGAMAFLIEYIADTSDDAAVCRSEPAPPEFDLKRANAFAWRRTFDHPPAIGYRIRAAAPPHELVAELIIFE